MPTEPKSIYLQDPIKPAPAEYTDDEKTVIGKLLYKMLNAKISRDTVKVEFNGQTYLQQFKNNEVIANTTIIRTEINKDLAVNSGTVEQKLLTILAEINNLNLTGEVRVYDEDNEELQELGTAITDIVHKTEEMEETIGLGNQEAKLMRQLELLKQGTVFIQDNWVKKWEMKKALSGDFSGKLKGTTWESKLEKVFDGPVRKILYGPGVFMGNIREFDMKKQPFIFTMELNSYQDVKTRYGMQDKDGKDVWERWANVPARRVSVVTTDTLTSMPLGEGWSITDLSEDMVEEIHYQDQINDEYQIFLNGIAMLPVGFPLSAITPGGMFNVEKQVLQVINPFFAYGKSFIAKTEQLTKLLDEMIRLLLLKTRKSIHPPYANISGKVISEKSLMPGAISMGIDPGALVAIGTEGQGVNASEYQMLQELRNDIDRVTISPQVQGQEGKSGSTAFEVGLLQQQAQKNLTLIVFACGLLEKKITWIRANYIIANYFEPVGTEVDEMRNELVSTYRQLSIKTTIDGRGTGTRKIIPVSGNHGITPEKVYNEEEYTGTPIPKKGSSRRRQTRDELKMEPLQILYINVDILKNCKYIFFTEVDAKPRDTSMNAKLMFREELKDLQALMQMGANVNIDAIQNDYALIWNKRKEKLFGKPQQMAAQLQAQGGGNVLGGDSPGMSNVAGAGGAPAMMSK